MMDQETIQLYLDFAVTSLYGKVGSADIAYEIVEYRRKDQYLIIATDLG